MLTSEPVQFTPPKDARVYFAAQRTFLAWIRTGLSLMGFGFVVARFGLFLQELKVNPDFAQVHSVGFSFWIGIALVIVGVFVNAIAAVHHIKIVSDLNRGVDSFSRPSFFAVSVAVAMAAVGLVMTAYLVILH